VGADRRCDLARTAAVISEIDADILALQEADQRFGARAGLLDLTALHNATGLTPVESNGHAASHGWHGNLLLLRRAHVEAVHKLVLPGFEPRGAVMADIVIAGRQIRVIAAHLGLLPRSRSAQTRALLDKISNLDARPTLLMGDLNEWRTTSAAMGHLTQHFTHSATVRSFPARYPLLALDRMMTCAHGELRDIATHDTPLSRHASDHLPIKARLLLRTHPDKQP
ncbi:MAG: endonuclease/exonuclease/phosphatase family protein, partial [Paracoccaceae bacterium]